MRTSLEHRFEVARANHNDELLAILELERSAIAPDLESAAKSMASPFARDKSMWKGLWNFLFPKAEIKVKRICDRAGNQWWYAYNPITGKSVYADTDTEMRVWIDQQYL
ncbi:MAG: hypothetical protein DCF20_00470 [Pseudanabaena sp.]|nr:MAG: hypothetical protein DCF20_00470 [Pseudanabaena sp.]